jgi:hypothetical protein
VHRSHRTRHPGGLPGRGPPAPGWGEPTGWSPLIDHGPLPLRAATSVARWWWPTLAVAGFLALAGFVLGHDDPAPGLSQRGLVTIALAAVVVVLLTIHRAAGPGPLIRALAEYTVVALLAMLLATTGVDVDQPPVDGTQASVAPDRRPALVKTLDGFRDWLAGWWQWADQEYDRRTQPSSTTPPKPKGEAMTLSPTSPPSTSTRRPT